jgi:hypothetical protein
VSQLVRALTKIDSELRGLGHSFALVGGLAVTLRTEPRFTQDADLAVSVTTDSEATKDDWTVASQAVELISQRGYARGRDLLDGLSNLRREGTSS